VLPRPAPGSGTRLGRAEQLEQPELDTIGVLVCVHENVKKPLSIRSPKYRVPFEQGRRTDQEVVEIE